MMNKQICRSILRSCGIETSKLEHIEIVGHDPVLPTSFLVGEAGAAALACVGYLSAELWKLKTGRLQSIHIAVRDAALAQRSHQYLKVAGQSYPLWDPLSGFYNTRDNRWIQYHCNFEHHKKGVLEMLSSADSMEAIAQATQAFDAVYLEDRLQKNRMCAAMVRTSTEWHQHAQYKSISAFPIIEIVQIASSKNKALPDGPRPLSNIKVLDLTRIIAGPVCRKTLAEQGADVWLINSPHLPNLLPLIIDTGFGKKSAYLDLELEHDQEKLRHFIHESDIFCQSYRPGGLAKKGFSVTEVATLNPQIIYVTIDAYTDAGPWANYHGFDTLLQSVTGIAWEQGSGVRPAHLPSQAIDYLTGYFAAIGVLEALRRRAMVGGAYHVKVSLIKTAKFLWDLGRVAYDPQINMIPDWDHISDLLLTTNSAFGTLMHLKPVLQMSETSPYYSFPPECLGSTQL